ncbi:MAG: efflux RND transporter periplasmic adaptor subunit [Planctomycetota bacterium]|jgi:multidrug efflux pump subunit AcrA (membrane-fusion protein)
MRSPFNSQRGKKLLARHWGKLLALQAIVLVGLGYVLASMKGGASDEKPATPASGGDVTAAAEGPTMWTCAMHPQIRQPSPGDCPICGMDLIPVAKTSGGLRTLTVSPEARALMSIETSPVERRYVTHEIRMVGKVDYDETKIGYITAWVPGRLDRLYVDYTGVEVRKGDHMVYIYSEQLYSAQQELIQALRFANERGRASNVTGVNLVEAAREKLRLLGLTEEQIKEIEKQGKPSDRLTIYAPVTGIVVEKLKQKGERVQLGDRIYTIADLNLVWVHLDAYEADLPWIRYGQDVTITTEAYPGEDFHGRIAFIQPVLNDKTRTVKVRVNVPNSDGKLKPDMFVHAAVRPKVAAGGRVMDSSLAGKWICPMHPEIVEDVTSNCDICGMPLERAESLGYVTPETDEKKPPLVIPYLAVLPTGTRAVVYVELPSMHSAAEPAFQTLSIIVQEGNLQKIREAFATYGNMLDRPYDHPGTDYAKRLWHEYADRLGRDALAGQRVRTVKEAEPVFDRIETTMNELRELFGPPGQPTFEGREIVLGPRAGDYYLVRNGLQEGELVVAQGNFKLDAEVQIQAKPSMMTPEGGGGGDQHADHVMTLPAEFREGIRNLETAYEEVTKAVQDGDPGRITAAFRAFGEALAAVDGNQLTGHPRMLWKEFAMLLSNDVVEGREAKQLEEADRVYLLLKGHVRRMREQLRITSEEERHIERIAVAPEFQSELARLWGRYVVIQQALAADDLSRSQQALVGFNSALASVDAKALTGRAQQVWNKEQANLTKLIDALRKAQDISAMRTEFLPLSQEIGVLAKSFGFGEASPVYELHCPMAFQNRGAVWYQDNDQVRNPYYGSTMLKCADRVEEIVHDEPIVDESGSEQNHSHH